MYNVVTHIYIYTYIVHVTTLFEHCSCFWPAIREMLFVAVRVLDFASFMSVISRSFRGRKKSIAEMNNMRNRFAYVAIVN